MKFLSKDLSIKLKEKGFNKPCYGYYFIEDKYENNLHKNITCGGDIKNCLRTLSDEKHIDAPTIEQTLKWLREEKDIMVFPVYSKNTSRWYCEIVNADSLESEKLPISDSYEDAAIAGIVYTIKNLI